MKKIKHFRCIHCFYIMFYSDHFAHIQIIIFKSGQKRRILDVLSICCLMGINFANKMFLGGGGLQEKKKGEEKNGKMNKSELLIWYMS